MYWRNPIIVRARRLSRLWRKAVNAIITNGELVERERGRVKEVRGLVAHLDPTGPKSFDVPEEYPLDKNTVKEYENQLLDPQLHGFEYTYGNRLREYFDIDQVKLLVDRLSESEMTRRAVATTWDPRRDSREEEVPCLIAVQLQSDGYNGLELHAFYRSWDVKKALVANIIALRRLHEHVADKVGMKPSSITVYSSNAHVYEEDL